MNHRRSFLVLIVICVSSLVQAQKKDSVRSLHIQRFPDHFFIWPVIKHRSTSFEFRNNTTRQAVRFNPENAFRLGVGAYLFEVLAEVTFALPHDQQRAYLYGKSGSHDVQANVLGKNWGADLFISNYRGFYLDDPENAPTPGQPYPQRADIKTHNLGMNGIYTFNRKKFSLRSSYNYAERQLRSKGSFLLSATVSSFRLTADSAVLSSKYHDTFGEVVGFHQLNYTSVGLAPGYTYNFIFKSFYLNTSLAVGPAQYWGSVKIGDESKTKSTLNTFAEVRVALGYNGQRFFGGVTFVNQTRNVKIGENTNFNNSSSTFKMLMGYRFREFGFLKRKVSDLLPPWRKK